MLKLGTLLVVVVSACVVLTILAFCALDKAGSRFWFYGSIYETKHNIVLTSPLRIVQPSDANASALDGKKHSAGQTSVSIETPRIGPSKSVPVALQVPPADDFAEGVDLQQMPGIIEHPLSC